MSDKKYYTELADNLLASKAAIDSLLSYLGTPLIDDDIQQAHTAINNALNKVLFEIGKIEYYGLEQESEAE